MREKSLFIVIFHMYALVLLLSIAQEKDATVLLLHVLLIFLLNEKRF